MANMSYCGFQNTLEHLRDCYYYFQEDNLSEAEKIARKRLIDLCKEIVEVFADETE